MNGGSQVALWVPIVAALLAAAVGFFGGAGIRLFFDRRQELVRAQAFGRVILDELESIAKRLFAAGEEQDAGYIASPLPTDAWMAHRADVGAVVLYEEFLALSQVYRAVEAFNYEAAAFFSRIPPSAHLPPLDAPLSEQVHVTWLMVTKLGTPSIEWLARGKLPFFRRRRLQPTLTPSPKLRCRCGHRWDSHRWEWRRRWLRLKQLRYTQRSVGHECNVRGCACRHFIQAEGPRWLTVLRRARLAPQVQYMDFLEDKEPPERDSSIPDSAQHGAVVSEDESTVLEMPPETREYPGTD